MKNKISLVLLLAKARRTKYSQQVIDLFQEATAVTFNCKYIVKHTPMGPDFIVKYLINDDKESPKFVSRKWKAKYEADVEQRKLIDALRRFLTELKPDLTVYSKSYYLPAWGFTIGLQQARQEIVRDFRHDYLLGNCLKKCTFSGIATDEQLYDDARSAFLKAEQYCREYNRIFQTLPTRLTRVNRVARIMDAILGPLVDALPRIQDGMGHGPGSTTQWSPRGATQNAKFSAFPQHTKELTPFVRAIMGERWYKSCFTAEAVGSPSWDSFSSPNSDLFADDYLDGNHFTPEHPAADSIVAGETFSTVPKNTLKVRPISIQPTLNVFAQKGVGKEIRRRLKKAGNCIVSGQQRNRYLVSRAIDKKLCTIDLENASGYMGLGVVENIMLRTPNLRAWLSLLKLLRCNSVTVPCDIYRTSDETHELHQLGGMGNGFVFEFETLLFLCIARSVVPREEWHHVSTYGDDIIVPQKYGKAVCELLKLYGFKINEGKTFLQGLFFESCGHDYFAGQYVRPFFFADDSADGESLYKDYEDLHVVPWQVRTANALRLYSYVIADGEYSASCYKRVYNKLLKDVENINIPYVAPSLGDSGIVAPISVAKPRRPQHEDLVTWEGWMCTALVAHLPRSEQCNFDVLLYKCNDLSSLVEGYLGVVRHDLWRFSKDTARSITGTLKLSAFDERTEGNSLPVLRCGYQIKRNRVFVPVWGDELMWGPLY